MILKTIINSFSYSEQQEFLLWTKQKNKRSDVKNIHLFKLIQKGETKDLDLKLYGKKSRNAYHALCKRLQDGLVDYIATKSFALETSEEFNILKLLLASRIFFEQMHYKIAFRALAKAEKMALELELYSILNEVYHTKIQYAHLNPKINLNQLRMTAELNLNHFHQEFRLNMAYATIKNKMNDQQYIPVNEIITKVFTSFNIVLDDALTYKSLYQLMNVVTTGAKLQSDYYAIDAFMINGYSIVKKKAAFVNKHLYYHLEILNLMAVTSFRNKNFNGTKVFILETETTIKQASKVHYANFYEKWLRIKALHYNYTGNNVAAISLLESYKQESLEVQLILVMCYFQQNRFKDAYQVFKKFSHSDIWYQKKTDWVWVLKKNIIEILLLIELDRLDLVFYRLQSFKRKFAKKLQEFGEERVLIFMRLVMCYYENPKTVTTKAFKDKVENSFVWVDTKREDIFVMSFYAWLKAKMEDTNLYETTLDLANQKIV